MRFLRRELPELYAGGDENRDGGDVDGDAAAFEVKKTSIFGEAEADIANW
jgi:homoserine O-acetyltransferase